MRARPKLKPILMIIVAAFLLAVIWAVKQGLREAATERERDTPAGASPRASAQNGESVITMNEETQARGGLVVSPLQPIFYREEIRAYGSVLELQGLVDLRKTSVDLRKTMIELRNGHAAAKAQVEKTRASLEASSKQYERQKALYEEDQNTSARTFEAAKAAWLSDQAAFQAAMEGLKASQKSIGAEEEVLKALEDSARQHWGPVIAGWLPENAPAFQRLIRQEDLLIQITLPAGAQVSPISQSIRIKSTLGILATAELVSPSPQTDPRIQGLSFLYVVPAQEGFLQGMNVLALLSSGSPVQGVVVPASAVVWWHGKAWVYVQENPEQFARREIFEKSPVVEGFFVHKGFVAGDRVVVKGAQLLLSEEVFVQRQGRKGSQAEE
jgi:hypothetical protein